MRSGDLSCCLEGCSTVAFVSYAAMYFGCIGCGGLLFMAIEGNDLFEKDDELISRLEIVKESFIKKFPNITGELLDDFVSDLSSAGLSQFPTGSNFGPKWTFSQAVFFCVTLVTTIGYGHIAPVSRPGKAVCMVYTAIGIPLTIVFVATSVSRLMSGARLFQNALSSHPRCRRLKSLSLNLITLVLAFVLVGLLFFVVPAAIFFNLEDNWSFLDAFYFCFISLTTVGLGDYVPGKQPNVEYINLYRLCVSAYLIFGVVALAFLMSLTVKCQNSFFYEVPDVEKEPFIPPSSKPGVPDCDITMEEKVPLLKKSKHSKIQRFYTETL